MLNVCRMQLFPIYIDATDEVDRIHQSLRPRDRLCLRRGPSIAYKPRYSLVDSKFSYTYLRKRISNAMFSTGETKDKKWFTTVFSGIPGLYPLVWVVRVYVYGLPHALPREYVPEWIAYRVRPALALQKKPLSWSIGQWYHSASRKPSLVPLIHYQIWAAVE